MSEDRVRFENQERLDRPDADALQELVYSSARNMLGGLLGPAKGLLAPFAWNSSDDGVSYFLTLDRCVVCHNNTVSTRVEDRGLAGAVNVGAQWDGLVHSFNPGEADHINHPVDYTAARAAELAAPGTKPYVWIRPFLVPADVDTRRIWDVATGAEVPAPQATRNRQRMEFAIADTAPAAGAGAVWVAIARVWAWSVGGEITSINMLSAWDDPDTNALLQDPGDSEDFDTDNASMAHPLQRLVEGDDLRSDGSVAGWPPGEERSAGLVYHLAWIRSRMQRMLSGGTNDLGSTVTRAWWAPPEISLNGAWEALQVHQTSIDSHNTRLLPLERSLTLCEGVVSFIPGGVYGAPYDVDSWALRQDHGVHSVIAMPLVNEGVVLRFSDDRILGREGWYISGVQVTPLWVGGHITNARTVRLLPAMLNAPQGDPAVWPTAAPLSSYKGAFPGLAANEYGILLATNVVKVVAGALAATPPIPGELTLEKSWAFSITMSQIAGGAP